MEGFQQIWDDLGAPAETVFYKALARKGISATYKQVREFIQTKSERQVIAPGPKYTGHIIAFDIDHRWMADIISFVSRPATKFETPKRFERLKQESDTPYTHVLLVQDVFSRQLWAKSMHSTSETTANFQEILNETARSPAELSTDGGTEFTSGNFKKLCKAASIEHTVKDATDRNGIATVDSAIGSIKRKIKRLVEKEGGSWLDHIDKAVKIHNSTEHSATGAPPEDMDADHRFSERKEMAEDMQDNTDQMMKRQKALEKAGGFRTFIAKPKGLKRRIDDATWSKDIHEIKGYPTPASVEDTQGNTFKTKVVKPVPVNSSTLAGVSIKPSTTAADLRGYATTLRDLLGGKGKPMGDALRQLKVKRPNFSLNANNLSFQAFVAKFPKLLRVQNGKVFPMDQSTL